MSEPAPPSPRESLLALKYPDELQRALDAIKAEFRALLHRETAALDALDPNTQRDLRVECIHLWDRARKLYRPFGPGAWHFLDCVPRDPLCRLWYVAEKALVMADIMKSRTPEEVRGLPIFTELRAAYIGTRQVDEAQGPRPEVDLKTEDALSLGEAALTLQHWLRSLVSAPALEPAGQEGGPHSPPQAPGGRAPLTEADPGADPPASPQYVTLNQIAGIMHVNKRTVVRWNRRTRNPMPDPDIVGRGGKAHQWIWDRIRPWLERDSGWKLPERYPTLQG
jgi:hypothetical protein